LFKTIGHPRIIEPEGELTEATKSLVSDFYYKYPTAIIDQLMDQMTSSFKDLIISKRTLYRYMADLWIFTIKKVQLEPVERNTPERIQTRKEWVEMVKELGVDYTSNCVFIDESGFNANLRRTQGWAPKGEAAKVKVLTARANSISILGAISAKGLIKISLRKPMVPSKKRKLAGDRKQQTKGTVTNHYVNFIKDVLAEMDKFPEMKRHYLTMDNVPIHTGKIIGEMIEERGYKYVYLPPYSPELNPIEQFWSVVKSSVKREFVLKKDAIPLDVLMTALQAILFNKQLCMRHIFFFEKHDTIFLNCAILFSKNIRYCFI
jgi:transposase